MAYSAKSVSNYLLWKAFRSGVTVTSMKLNKLVYFAHGWHLAIKHRPLIKEPVQAWQHGPVIPTIYYTFKRYGNQPIAAPTFDRGNKLSLPSIPPNDSETARFLDRVWDTYKTLTAKELSDLSHEAGSPWHVSRSDALAAGKTRAIRIDNRIIKDYFLTQLQEGSGPFGGQRWPFAIEHLDEPLAVSLSDSLKEPLAKAEGQGRWGAPGSRPYKEPQKPTSLPRHYFDVFLCYNFTDKLAVRHLANKLSSRGLSVWLDEQQIRPGLQWQTELEKQIESIRSAAVCIGQSGIGPWQDIEMRAVLSALMRRGDPVIPVILPSVGDQPPDLPLFLRERAWVDLRIRYPDPLERLIYGITGEKTY